MLKYNTLQPDALRKIREKSIVFLPLGPLEWHGPHLPFGTDGIIAQYVAEHLAEKENGILMPTLFAGLAPQITAETRQALCVTAEKAESRGMDFSTQGIPSLYMTEEALESILADYVHGLAAQEFQRLVILCGHGANAPVLNRICSVAYADMRVTWYPALLPFGQSDINSGHATMMETAVMMAIHPELVNLEALPQDNVPLRCAQWGVADDCYFMQPPKGDGTVIADPRMATAELGRKYLNHTLTQLHGELSAET